MKSPKPLVGYGNVTYASVTYATVGWYLNQDFMGFIAKNIKNLGVLSDFRPIQPIDLQGGALPELKSLLPGWPGI